MMIDTINETSYQEAERLIAEAAAIGATHLALNSLRIEDLPASLGNLTQLESLDLSQCYWLEDISGLSKLVALKSLDLGGCDQVSDLSVLANLTALQSICLSSYDHAPDFSALANLADLRSIDLGWGDKVTDLSSLANLPYLQSLNLSGCDQVTDLSVLASLTALQSLNLSGCDQVTDLSALANLTALRSLNLSECDQVIDLSVLANLTALQLLSLELCNQITDLSVLTSLTALQSLDLSGCNQVTDLSVLANLTALQSLDLSGCDQVTDISMLANLTAIQSLDLNGCDRITDLSMLSNFTALQSFGLNRCNQVADFSVLLNLTALQSLNLSRCNQLTNLSALVNLAALQSLNLRGCDQLTDLSVLSNLAALQSLTLGSCEQLSDLSGLANLTTLQSLDLDFSEKLIDLSVLANLFALQELGLCWCNNITDLSALMHLTALQSLDLSGCDKVTDLSALAHLTALHSLDLGGCDKITDLSPLANLTALNSLGLIVCDQVTDLSMLANLSKLRQLTLSSSHMLTNRVPLAQLGELRRLRVGSVENSSLAYISPRLVSLGGYEDFYVDNAPPELFYGDAFGNCLSTLIPWQRDIYASGAAPNTELKLFVLGNGRVGKTQIVRRLQNQDYDPSIASTHGIALGRFEVLAPEDSNPAIYANLWDFGGQDVYLGTHGLFLDARAVYVVVWHPDHENDSEYFENGVPMHNRPLAYWLAYIRSLAGADAPIIVVQSQCDRESSVVPPPLPDAHGFTRLRISSCSAVTSYGIELLWPEIRSAARLLRDRYAAVQIPQSWVAVSEKLRELRVAGKKALSFAEFEKLCHTFNGMRYPNIVAGYLHRAGQVFWREGAFGNDLLLDQVWALAGIYALLERGEILPMIRDNHGCFSLWQLQKTVWSKYGDKEQKLFIDMMQQCGACFPLGNGQYIAAELLPSERQRRADIDTIWRDAEVAARVELHYEFLHDGIIKAILCRIGDKAGNAGVYWRNGVCYFDREVRGAVRISAHWEEGQVNTRRGLIIVEVEGLHAGRLAAHLVQSIETIRIGEAPQVTWCCGQPAEDQSSHHQSADENKVQAPFARVAPDSGLGGRAAPMQGLVAECAQHLKRKSILLMATEWQSHHGGLSTFNRELCLALAQLDNDVYCAVAEASDDDIERAKEKNVTLVKARPVASGDPIQGLLCKLPLPADFQPDVIVGHGRITGQAAKIQREDHFQKAKRIHFVHMAAGEIEWFKGKKDAAQLAELREGDELDLAQDASLVAAVGPRLLRETATLIDRLEPAKRPAIVQFNPGFKQTESRQSLPHSLHCLMLGRAEDESLKGVDIAASAMQQIDNAKLKHKPELIIRGAPVDAGTALRDKLTGDYVGLSVRVKEYSAEEGKVEADFRSAALALMPSRREGFGLVALEALSVGTPVLVSEHSGFAELLKTLMDQHEWDNYIVETPDVLEQAAENWRDKIFFELKDVDASARRAKKLADILAETLTWRKSCEGLIAELGKV